MSRVIQGPWRKPRPRMSRRFRLWFEYVFDADGVWGWVFALCVLAGLTATFVSLLVLVSR